MSKVLIYGASDDLIEVRVEGSVSNGDYEEEYSYDEDPRATMVVIGGDRSVVEVTPVLSDIWTATVKVIRQGSDNPVNYSLVPSPNNYGEEGDLAVEIDLPSALVYKTVKQ